MTSRFLAFAVLALLATTVAADAAQHHWRVVGRYVGTCRGHPNGSTWTERDKFGRVSIHKCILEGEPLPGGHHRHKKKR